MCQRYHRHINLHLIQLPNHQCRPARMTRDQQQVRLSHFDFGQGRRHIVQLRRQFIINHNLHTKLCDRLNHARAHILRKGIIFKRHRNFNLGSRFTLLMHQINGTGEILLSGGKHRKQIAIVVLEKRKRRPICFNHRHLVAFCNRRHRFGQPRRIRPQHKTHAVLQDQPFRKLCAPRRRRFIVIINHRQLIGDPVNQDAAALIDFFHRHVISPPGQFPIGGIFARQRHRSPKINRRAFNLGLCSRRHHAHEQHHRPNARQCPINTQSHAVPLRTASSAASVADPHINHCPHNCNDSATCCNQTRICRNPLEAQIPVPISNSSDAY